MTETTTKSHLQLFCGTESGRYNWSEPFVLGEWEYATDGQVAVRIPSDKPATTGRKLPDVETIFRGFGFGHGHKLGTPVYDDIIELCQCCYGLNSMPDDWSSDDGEWGDDDGECRDCHGFGRVLISSCERIGNRLIRMPNAKKMRLLPGLLVASGGTCRDSLRFKFDGGGQGIVCPVVRHGKK